MSSQEMVFGHVWRPCSQSRPPCLCCSSKQPPILVASQSKLGFLARAPCSNGHRQLIYECRVQGRCPACGYQCGTQ